MAHLREEKAQTLPWPPMVKACFETTHVKVIHTTQHDMTEQDIAQQNTTQNNLSNFGLHNTTCLWFDCCSLLIDFSIRLSCFLFCFFVFVIVLSCGCCDGQAHVTSCSLLGSPMLDIALGQVDALHKVLEELHDGVEQLPKRGKNRDDCRLQQIDSLLPPEVTG